MKIITLKNEKFPDDALFDVLNRDAALWVSSDAAQSSSEIDMLANLMLLPWKLVLCEITTTELYSTLDSSAQKTELIEHRGFHHLVCADPSTRPLPSRALPIYFLNGHDEAQDILESSRLSGIASKRRRLNMLDRLLGASPKRLVLIGKDLVQVLDQLEEMWQSDFRSLLTIVTLAPIDIEYVESRCHDLAALSSLSIVSTSLDKFAPDVIRRGLSQLPDTKIVLRVRDSEGSISEVDVTSAELPEQPILDHFDVIKSRDLRNLTESDLTIDDIDDFFGRGNFSWRPYAAGLPWIQDQSSEKTLINALLKKSKEGSESTKVFYIVSEGGAGGTTLARYLAFSAAASGFPTLLAKPDLYAPNATELVSFINRVRTMNVDSQKPSDNNKSNGSWIETPWLIVLDRSQWDGQEQQIGAFLSEINRSGRSVVVLKVLGTFVPSDLIPVNEIAYLSHELDREDVVSLGTHLNKFLKPFGRGKNHAEWEQFWDLHKPDINNTIAAFWVTLDFWLRGLINIGDSVQEWLLKQFKQCPIENDVRKVVLEIAALTIERRSVPEQLLTLPQSTLRPLSVILEELRSDVPSFALIRQSLQDGRLWAMAHDVLGRYLINACYQDRKLMDDLGLYNIQSPTELRLHLIGTLTRRSEIGENRFRAYAVQFAVKTLKLDDEGNAEFFQFWREVIRMLDEFPPSIRDSSRAFNHHVAISRRRVAQIDVFDSSVDEKREQLKLAVTQLEYAILRIDETHDDESNLNLYNSLALTYQDLAALESNEGGSADQIADLLFKANDATLSALKESPNNPYVLETAAKNLIQQGSIDDSVKVSCAAESLGYVFQAARLENSSTRQYKLAKLASQALSLLRNTDAGPEIERMIAAENPMGFLAAAWLKLTKEVNEVTASLVEQVSEEAARAALEILSEAPRHWLIVRLQYDIVSILEPRQFERQLRLLDELDGIAAYRMSLQLRLNQAILLHLVGRHSDANSRFKGLRREIQNRNEIVEVPENLKWLVGSDGETKYLCTARVVDSVGYRSFAQVSELKNAVVPFIAQDFGTQKMPTGMTFKCNINFGAMGPFIKPPIKVR